MREKIYSSLNMWMLKRDAVYALYMIYLVWKYTLHQSHPHEVTQSQPDMRNGK